MLKLLVILLARLGAAVAAFGCLVGARNWDTLNRPKKDLTVFLGVSASCGIAQAVFASFGLRNIVFGNLWKLGIFACLMPSMIGFLPGASKSQYTAVQRVCVAAWIIYFLLLHQLNDPSDLFYAAQCIILFLLSMTLLYHAAMNCRRETDEFWRSPAFVLAVSCAVAFACDILPHASDKWLLNDPNQFGRALKAFRNAIWVAGYAGMTHVLMTEQKARKNV